VAVALALDGSLGRVGVADAVAGFVFANINMAGYPVPWILFWLILAGIFCTFYFGFINVRGLAQGFRIIRGDYADPAHSGDTSHFQALATALSGTVGLGNIAGVAAAIALGGLYQERGMPSFAGRLTPQEIELVRRYVLALAQQAAAAAGGPD